MRAASLLLEASIQVRAVLRTALAEAETGTAKARVLTQKIELLSEAIARAQAEGIERAVRQDA